MKDTLYLDNPIMINGKKVSELTYDATEITAVQFTQACAYSSALDKTQSFSFKMRENDYALHMYLGFMAVIAVNPDIDIKDLERIKGLDINRIANVGLLFTLGRLVGDLEGDNSEKQSESTADISTQA